MTRRVLSQVKRQKKVTESHVTSRHRSIILYCNLYPHCLTYWIIYYKLISLCFFESSHCTAAVYTCQWCIKEQCCFGVQDHHVTKVYWIGGDARYRIRKRISDITSHRVFRVRMWRQLQFVTWLTYWLYTEHWVMLSTLQGVLAAARCTAVGWM